MLRDNRAFINETQKMSQDMYTPDGYVSISLLNRQTLISEFIVYQFVSQFLYNLRLVATGDT